MSKPSQKRPKQKAARRAATPAHEAVTAVLRTAEVLRRRVAVALVPHEVTAQQYAVLRILRDAHPAPLPTLEVGDRMVEETPGITRLLDRLEAEGWVRRERGVEDRRQVHCAITPAGLALVNRLDAPIAKANGRAVEPLSASEVQQLVRLLLRMRGEDGGEE
jgi:DNA-binding MarR family transcriptional regulator